MNSSSDRHEALFKLATTKTAARHNKLDRSKAFYRKMNFDTLEGLYTVRSANKLSTENCRAVYVERLKERNEDEWLRELEGVIENHKDETDKDKLFQLAEVQCIERGVIPPHWTSSTKCPNCGLMPAPKRSVACAWCQTETGLRITDFRKQTKKENKK